MWQSKKTEEIKRAEDLRSEKYSTNEVKSFESTSDKIDSGFLSGANIGCTTSQIYNSSKSYENQFEEEDSNKKKKKKKKTTTDCFSENNTKDPMRVDSGIVEFGICETLSQLSLKPVTINSLKGKIHTEPIKGDELSPIINHPRLLTNHSGSEKLHRQRNDYNLIELNIKNRQTNDKHFPRLYYSQDEDGDTQLHIAIVQGFHEVSLSLIRMAPDTTCLDSLNQKRQSPLHLAILTHQPTIVRKLILAGANPTLRNSDGNTALHLAAASGDLACAKALTDPLSKQERTYLDPGKKHTHQIPQDLEQRNYEGETCLHSAVVAGNEDIVRLLVQVGADLEAKERLGGRTALHLAIECRRRGVTSLLLKEYRPHLDAITYGGLTPYEIASCSDSQIAIELVKLGATRTNENLDYNNVIDNNDVADNIQKISQYRAIGLRA